MTRSTSSTGKRTPTPEDVLRKALEAVEERGAELGDVNDTYQLVADLWFAYIAALEEGAPLTVRDVMRMMVLFKIGRDMAAPSKVDHAVDVAGYAALFPEANN